MAKPEVMSHWHHGADGLSASAESFYKTVEAAIKRRQFPGIKIKRKKLKEGGMFSAKREYLHVEWKDYCFDIGAAPFGTVYYFSSWQTIKRPLLPPGELLDPETFYRVDAGTAFQEVVNTCVVEAVDALVKAKGLRALSEAERKPKVRDILK